MTVKATERIVSGSRKVHRRCLVVTDGGTTLLAARLMRLLDGFGFSVFPVSGMHEALQSCWRNMPGALFVPLAMEGMHGSILLRHLGRMPGAGECVAIGYGERMDAAEAGRMIWEGAADCITFPVDAHLLDLKLRQAGILPLSPDESLPEWGNGQRPGIRS